MTFQDIFKSSFLENMTEFSVTDVIIGMTFAVVCGLFIFLIYQKTFSGVMYSAGFAMTLVGLSLVTTLVIMAGKVQCCIVSWHGGCAFDCPVSCGD